MFSLNPSIDTQDKHASPSGQKDAFIAKSISISTTESQPLRLIRNKRTSITSLSNRNNSINTSAKGSTKMLKVPQSRSSTLNTRNPINKRHSIMISPYSTDIQNSVDSVTIDEDIDNESESFIDLKKSFNRKHRSQSLTSFTNLADDEFNNTMDTDEILKDINDEVDKKNDTIASVNTENYQLVVNNALSDFNTNSIHSNIETDDSSESDSFIAVNKKLHPLRKLVISSPNSSCSTPKTRIISRSTSNTALKIMSELLPPTESHSSLSNITFDPKKADNCNSKTLNNESISSNTIMERISKLKYKKPQCQVISNCIFFGPIKEVPQSPAKPSETNASDVFDCKDESPLRKRTIVANFATAVVDPELFTKSAGTVFSGPTIFPSRQRTSLHFV